MVARNTTDTMTNKRLSDTTTSIVNAADITKSVVFNVAGATTATATNLFFAQTTTKNITFPNSSDTLVGKATSDIMTNKTITDTTNNVAANSLKSATTLVNVAAATAPSSGQLLIATSSTTATWQNISAGISIVAPTAATDANGAIISGSTLQLEFATATNPGILSVAAQTLAGTKTFSSAVIISPANNQVVLGTTNTTTINAVAPASSITYSIPDTGSNSSFVMTDGTQIINGSKTFSSAVTINPVINQITLGTTNTTTITAPAPASSITLTLPNSASDTIVARNTTDTITNKIIQGATNIVDANNLKTTGASVNISSAATPSTGQVLAATSATTAIWQSSPGSMLLFGTGITNDPNIGAGITVNLAADTYYANLTIAATGVLKTNNFRLFVKGTIINNGTISNNGVNAVGTTGAIAIVAGTLGSGVNGVNGNASNGIAGLSVTANTQMGGNSIISGAGATTTSGSAPASTFPAIINGGSNVFSDYHCAISGRDIANIKLNGGNSSPSAGGNGGSNLSGASGSSAGIMVIAANNITGSGLIQANGGNSANSVSGNCGGTSGSAAGCIVLVYNFLTLPLINITANGGLPGLPTGTGHAGLLGGNGQIFLISG